MMREGGHRGLEVGAALSDVRAEAQVAAVPVGHGAKPEATGGLYTLSRHTSTETSPTGSGRGGSGLAALTQTEYAP